MAAASAGRAICMLSLVIVTSQATLLLAFGRVLSPPYFQACSSPPSCPRSPMWVDERELIDANSVMSQIDMVSIGAGPAIASFILLVGSYRTAFVVAAIGLFACSGAVVSLSRARSPNLRSGIGKVIAGSPHRGLSLSDVRARPRAARVGGGAVRVEPRGGEERGPSWSICHRDHFVSGMAALGT